MKAVLMSIQPKFCELIASGKKTVEVRKTKPQIAPPFKCYIYCTKNTRKHALHTYINSGYGRKEFGVIGQWRSGKEVVDVNSHLPSYRYNAYLAEGKVIGEFVCDRIDKILQCNSGWVQEYACISREEFFAYLGLPYNSHFDKKGAYGWHISNLVIYDEPRELEGFIVPSKIGCCNEGKCRGCKYLDRGNGYNIEDDCNAKFSTDEYKPLRRAPQSWCYVEEVEV